MSSSLVKPTDFHISKKFQEFSLPARRIKVSMHTWAKNQLEQKRKLIDFSKCFTSTFFPN